MFRVLRREGLRFDVAIGRSLGEFSALVATGALSFQDALRIVRRRGQEMLAPHANPGGMAAVIGLDDATVQTLCDEADGVWAANFNCPGQIVVSGARPALEKFGEQARAAGAKRSSLCRSAARFHSPRGGGGARASP